MASEFKKLQAANDPNKQLGDYLLRAYNIITLNFVSSEEEFNQKIKERSKQASGNGHYGLEEKSVQQQQNGEIEIQEKKNIQTETETENDTFSYFDKEGNLNPKYTHQIFGEEEHIYGYKDLKIDFYFTTGRLFLYIHVEYSDKTSDADDYKEIFGKWIFASHTYDMKEFKRELQLEQIFKPTGENIDNFTLEGVQYSIFRSHDKCEGFHELRVNTWTLLLFFIEVASYCHSSDYWTYYTLYKQLPNQQYVFVGVLTLTEFHIDLNYKRNRISQVLIMPQYQRKGLGCRLTESVYNYCIFDENCLQITVEDCEVDFQNVRDIVETQQIIKGHFFDFVDEILPKSIALPTALMSIQKDKKIFDIIARKIKLPKFQINRVFEILLLSKIDGRYQKVREQLKQIIIERIKKEQEQPKRKKPCLIIDGEEIQFDVELITMVQNKQLNQDKYYEDESEFCLKAYDKVLKKLEQYQQLYKK